MESVIVSIMKIVVTNPSGLTENHLAELRKLGEVEVYGNTNNDNYAERVQGAEIAVIDCFLTPVASELLSKTPDLKFFSINSTGFDKVDVEAVKNAGIVASNVPGFSTESVAELAIGLMFAANRKIAQGDHEFRNGLYEVDPGTPEATRFAGFNLNGKTLGVIGLGNIGTRITEIGKGIGMNVIGYNRTDKDLPDVKTVSLEELTSQADVAVLSLALNDQTKDIITKEHIGNMKKSAIFVSIAGLGLVDQKALIEALNNDLIAGAAIDTADADFIDVKNTVLTPHIGYDTRESDENMGRIILENIQAYTNGSPINQIA